MDLLAEADITCPYCGENFRVTIDTSQGDCGIVEDCTVCCQPIQLDIESRAGEVLAVSASRA
jgi:transcription elongation factor Elf1